MNTLQFTYTSANGTIFFCETCDFSTPVKVKMMDEDMARWMYTRDVAEMIGYHATNIWPELNGFQGYDCINFVIS